MDRIGRYQILSELGRGAMGAVYKALDPQIDRTVAIKVILTANLSPKELENYKQRFYREARAAGKMSHGSIVTIYDITEDAGGQPYLVMEFVEGRTLDQVMAECAASGQPLPLQRALGIGKQVAEALDYAHRRGVVHRDVKPANILLTEDGVAKIADFGIAKMEGVQLTQTGHMLGTPAFMSPEQFSGGAIDARADLFSLGAILYWMLTGQKPFHAETLSMVTYKVVFADPPAPTQANPALPANVDPVLARALAKKPEARYAACKELAEDLDALLAGKPVRATPLSPFEQTALAPPAPEVAPADAPQPVERTVAQPVERTVAQPGEIKAEQTAPTLTKTPAAPRKPSEQAARPARRMAWLLLLVLIAGGTSAYFFWPRTSEPIAQETPAVSSAAPQRSEQAASTKKAEEPKTAEELPQTAVAPPPEPTAEPASVAPKNAEPDTEEKPRDTGPPPWAKGKGRRGRSAAAESSVPAGPTATLRVECLHNFRDGVLEISSSGRTLLRASLVGDAQDLGLVKIYNGSYNADITVPAGDNLFHVRVRSNRSNFDGSDEIGGLFAENGTRTLVIEFGKGSGLKVVSRKLTLHWK